MCDFQMHREVGIYPASDEGGREQTTRDFFLVSLSRVTRPVVPYEPRPVPCRRRQALS